MGAVVVAAVGAGLEVGRRDRARRVPQAAPPPRPRVRGAARLQPDPGRRQLAEELRHLAASHLPAQHCLLALVDPMHLKDVLGGIQANPDNHHWAAPLAALFNHHSLAHSMPSGAVHPNINIGLWNMGSGLAAARRPGMTGLSVQRLRRGDEVCCYTPSSSATLSVALRPWPVRMTTVVSSVRIVPSRNKSDSAAAPVAAVGSTKRPRWPSAASAGAISGSGTATTPPCERRSALSTSAVRTGFTVAMPSATVGADVNGT